MTTQAAANVADGIGRITLQPRLHLAGFVRNQTPVLRQAGVFIERFFKPQPKLARGGLAVGIEGAVIGHLVEATDLLRFAAVDFDDFVGCRGLFLRF